jgi:hypothetical protein
VTNAGKPLAVALSRDGGFCVAGTEKGTVLRIELGPAARGER